MSKVKVTLNQVKHAVLDAEKRIRNLIRETPLDHSPVLSELTGCEVYLKLETCQISGSFKYRGALNFVSALSREEQEKSFVTSSTGNHGAAFCEVMRQFGLKGRIVMPENTPDYKAKPLQLAGTDVIFYGSDCLLTEMHARKTAEENELIYVPPYNDFKIVGGQGTVAVELLRQLNAFDAVFVPVGGGGLISGMAGYLKTERPQVLIIGCQPENSPVMAESIKAGKILEMESKPTLSDATAGGIEKDSITFPICQQSVDQFVLISEEKIEESVRLMMEHCFLLAEGGAALSLASLIQKKEQFKNKKVVLIITGKRIGSSALESILCKED